MTLLLFEGPVQRLLHKLRRLALDEQKAVWSVYRRLRRSLKSIRLSPLASSQGLADLHRQGVSLRALSLGLRLAQTYTWQSLGAQGASRRRERLLAQEHFHLVRRYTRHALGLRALPPEPRWVGRREPSVGQAWEVVCDGSQKRQKSSVGVLVRDPTGSLLAEVALCVRADTALQAELWACIRGLETALALHAYSVRMKVDSLGVIRAFEGRLPLRYCVEEGRLQQLVSQLDAFCVELVSRVETAPADTLAAGLSLH